MALNAGLVGKEYSQTTYQVTADAIEKYARATNDRNERYLAGEDAVASPLFPMVPAFESFMGAAMDPELRADFLRLVHAAQEHVLHEPIRAGDELTVKTVLESVDQEDGGGAFTLKAIETNQNGVVVAEVRGTMLIRGGRPSRRRASADEGEREVLYEETARIDEDQARRYAEASGDHNPIHLDESAAKDAGLPGVVNHGMCTLAVAARGAVDVLAEGDPTRIERIGARFYRPVFPGDELTTKFWKLGSDATVTSYGFETYKARARAVIKNGIVEIARG